MAHRSRRGGAQESDVALMEALASVNYFLLQAGFPHTSRCLVSEVKKAGRGPLPQAPEDTELTAALLAALGIDTDADSENLSPQCAAVSGRRVKPGAALREAQKEDRSHQEEDGSSESETGSASENVSESESASGGESESESESESEEEVRYNTTLGPSRHGSNREQKQPARLHASIRGREEGRAKRRGERGGGLDKVLFSHTKPVARLKGHRSHLVHLEFVGPGSRYAAPGEPACATLFSASADAAVRVWTASAARGAECVALARGPEAMTDARPIEGAAYAVCASSGGEVVLLDLASDSVAQTFAPADAAAPALTLAVPPPLSY